MGAGSLSHGKRLIDDLLTVKKLAGGSLVLMGIHPARLEVVAAYARRSASALMPSLGIIATTGLEEALEGADIVLSLFDAGGFAAFDLDWRIARSHGLDTCIGDTVGPLGTMRALRNGKVMLGLASAMAEHCPQALLVNYVNPMAPMVSAAALRGIACVGICGGVESTRSFLARTLGLEGTELRTVFAGVNHLAWLLELGGPGGDLYPRFRELMRDAERSGAEAVRAEILQQFGYFATESSGHLSDFFPWFRRDAGLRTRYCSAPGYAGASGAYHKLSAFLQRRIGQADYLEGAEPSMTRSPDYGSAIVEALLGGGSLGFHGNVPNHDGSGSSLIPALPLGACVELPVLLKGGRLSFPAPPRLPPQLAALCMPSALQAGLALEALLCEDPELVFAAMAADPLTSSVLDLPGIRSLASQLLKANEEWLPQGLKSPLRETGTIVSQPGRARPRSHGEDPMIALVRDYERKRREGRRGSGPSRGS